MLEKPDLPDQTILTRLREEYGLPFAQVTFLPLGADINTAVYRAVTAQGEPYFLKLRRGSFDPLAVELPHILRAQGNAAIIAPLETRAGALFGSLDPYQMVLYPFIDGRDAYEQALTDAQWTAFGAALHSVHSTRLPPGLEARIPREEYSPRYRDLVREFLAQAQTTTYADPTAAKMAAFLQNHRAETLHIVTRADQLGLALASRPLEFVLCHADIHPGNLLITPEGALYIVDWDNPLIAPKEKDLALVGGCSTWKDPREALLFHRGYGPAPVDQSALAYFRYERIIQDIAEFGKQLLLSNEGSEDREQAYRWFISNYQPGGEIELARAIDEGLELP